MSDIDEIKYEVSRGVAGLFEPPEIESNICDIYESAGFSFPDKAKERLYEANYYQHRQAVELNRFNIKVLIEKFEQLHPIKKDEKPCTKTLGQIKGHIWHISMGIKEMPPDSNICDIYEGAGFCFPEKAKERVKKAEIYRQKLVANRNNHFLDQLAVEVYNLKKWVDNHDYNAN